MFKNRQEAGKELAKKLSSYQCLAHHVVVGLARGGVVVAKEVALALNLPLDVLAPRKIGFPQNPEYALGAVQGGVVVLDAENVEVLGITKQEIQRIIQEETKEMQRRESLYRKGRKGYDFQDNTVL